MSIQKYSEEKLWPILVETVHAMVMYPNHKGYVREVILQEKPETTPMEVASRLNIPLGEALVIMYELTNERRKGSSNEPQVTV
jgi:hypothetical protein